MSVLAVNRVEIVRNAPLYQPAVDPGMPLFLGSMPSPVPSEPTAFLSVLRGCKCPSVGSGSWEGLADDEYGVPSQPDSSQITPSSPAVQEDNGTLTATLQAVYQSQPAVRPDGANAMVWENVPTQRGVTFHSLLLPVPVLKSTLDSAIQGVSLSPSEDQLAAGIGMFVDGQGNPLLPESLQTLVDGDALAGVRFANRPGAISFLQGGQLFVAQICFYLVLDSDLVLGNATPPITAYFSSQGTLTGVVDARGQTVGAIPFLAPLLTFLKWGAIAALIAWFLDRVISPILAYFGWISKETKIGTQVLQFGRKVAGQVASMLWQNVVKPVLAAGSGIGAMALGAVAVGAFLWASAKRAGRQLAGEGA